MNGRVALLLFSAMWVAVGLAFQLDPPRVVISGDDIMPLQREPALPRLIQLSKPDGDHIDVVVTPNNYACATSTISNQVTCSTTATSATWSTK